MSIPPEQVPMIVAAVTSTIAAVAGCANWLLATMRGHDRRLEAEARERMQAEDHAFKKWSYENGKEVLKKQDELAKEVHNLTPISVQPIKE